MSLTLEQVVIGVGAALILGLGSLVLWFVRRERDGIAHEIKVSESEGRSLVSREIETLENRSRERHDALADQVRRIERDLHGLRESLPDRYAGKFDFVEFRGWLTGRLDRIEDKINTKADKGL